MNADWSSAYTKRPSKLELINNVQVGWPMMLPSKDRRPFAGKVHDLKKKHLDNMVMDGKLPLRPGQLSTLYPQLLATRDGADAVFCRKHTACTADIIELSDTECYTTLGTASDEHCMLSCLLQLLYTHHNGKKSPCTVLAGCSTCSNFLAGIADFIDAALDKDAAIGLVAGTCSIAEEQIMTAALFALGEERSQKLHTFVCNPQQQSQEGEGQPEPFEGLSIEQSMAAARARVSCSHVCNSRLDLCLSALHVKTLHSVLQLLQLDLVLSPEHSLHTVPLLLQARALAARMVLCIPCL